MASHLACFFIHPIVKTMHQVPNITLERPIEYLEKPTIEDSISD